MLVLQKKNSNNVNTDLPLIENPKVAVNPIALIIRSIVGCEDIKLVLLLLWKHFSIDFRGTHASGKML
jgi:hypothetical protein